jgi:putative flippase GtrA/4-amino-4-deoxy-L-arabinose transferase-like glycosyltransferase
MANSLDKEKILTLISQLWKFGVVGVVNTGVDFLITNLLFWFFKPAGMFGLMLISIFAITAAAVNSYFLNKFWTFNKKTSMKANEIYRFSIVTFLGMIVNTSIFLFASKYLSDMFAIEGFVNINAARLAGVAAAMGVTFLGYRFGVFETENVNKFRKSFSFSPDDSSPRWSLLTALMLVAIFLRVLFLFIAPVTYGDAIHYNWNAYFLTHNAPEAVDWFWHSLFTYWEGLLFFAGASRYTALVLSSMIPGVLLIIPLYLVAKNLFGKQVALFAALASVFHPRLIEYSVNGYSESLVIFFILWSIWGMERILTRKKSIVLAALVGGSASAFYFTVRNEALLIIILFLLILIIDGVRRKKIEGVLFFLLAFSFILTPYIGLNYKISNTPPLFQKSTNLHKEFSEKLDLAESVKEVYSEKGRGSVNRSSGEIFLILLKRYPRNLLYLGERLPGVLFSPIILFIPFLWLMTKRKRDSLLVILPLWTVTLFPFCFYPLFQIEPRYLFFALPTLQILGVAGLIAFFSFILQNGKLKIFLKPLLFALTALAFLPFIFVVAWNSESKRGYHREIGEWIEKNIPDHRNIAGAGYGYCNTFWAGIPKKHSSCWAETPEKLKRDTISHDCSLLIVNEEFLKKANKELLPVLDNGIPGMIKIKEFSFPRTGRIQLYIMK